MKYAIFCVTCERWMSLQDFMPEHQKDMTNELRNVIPLFPNEDIANSALRRAIKDKTKHAKTCEIIPLGIK